MYPKVLSKNKADFMSRLFILLAPASAGQRSGGNSVNTAKNKMKQLSAYNIFWAIATPVKGKATKSDLKIAGELKTP